MKKILSVSSIVFLLVLAILNYEYFFFNAEGIFIISFLLFTFLFNIFAGDVIGSGLDSTNEELALKLKELTRLQKTVLIEHEALYTNLKNFNTRVLPVFIYVLSILEERNAALLKANKAVYRNFIEKNCRELLIDNSLLNADINNFLLNEILSEYERSLS